MKDRLFPELDDDQVIVEFRKESVLHCDTKCTLLRPWHGRYDATGLSSNPPLRAGDPDGDPSNDCASSRKETPNGTTVFAGSSDSAGLRSARDDLHRSPRRLRLRQPSLHLHGTAGRAELRVGQKPGNVAADPAGPE